MSDDSTAIGMNLAANFYWATEFPFLNRMKSAGSWTNNHNSNPIALDADGYPTALPAGASDIYTMVGVDPLSAGTDSTYVLTYTGTANFFLGGAVILSSEPGKIVFQYTNATSNQMLVAVNGLDPSSPLGNMAIVRSDQEALYQSGEIFNPAFISKISAFDTLRYMDWGATNPTTVQNWSDRTTPDDMSWQGNATSSVPIETMVALANESHTNMWLNVPAQATDDYVRQMMTYVHDNLDPTLSVHLEYSNEVWNWSFPQATYAMQKGDQLWGVDANGDGTIDHNTEGFYRGWVTYYGYRAAQVASIANQVWGADDDRLHNVLSTQTVWEGLESWITDGVARANVGSVNSLFDDYAVTTYFNGNLNGVNAADQATILSWAQSGAAGLTAAFAALKDGTGLTAPDNGSLAWLRGVLAYQGGVAQSLGLNLVAYEGGVDLIDNNFTAYGANAGVVQDFMTRLQNDPRMGEIYTQMVSDFSAAGGKLLNPLIDIDSSLWGTLKSVYDSGSPEWDALLAAASAGRSTATSPATGTTPVTSGGTTSTTPSTGGSTSTTVTTGSSGTTTTTPTTGSSTSTTVTTGSSGTTTTPTTGSSTSTTVTTGSSSTGTGSVSTGSGQSTVNIPVIAGGGTTAPTSVASTALAAGQTSQATYTLGASETAITYVGSGLFTAVGNNLGDVITAGDGGSHITGGTGNDTLIGGAGSDYLDGGSGIDRLAGGGGNDTYAVGDYRAQVVEASGGGSDTINTTLGVFTLTDNVENLTFTGNGAFQALGNGLDNIITGGQGPNRLSGGAGNDTLIGGAGNDVLDGGIGADRMVGGGGNDIYFVDNVGDQVVEGANGGTDAVFSSIDYTLADNVENLTLMPGATKGIGNALDNVITGNAQDNYLSGGAGNDTLNAGSGTDTLDGGDGNDTLVAGFGRDTLTGGAGADRFVFHTGTLAANAASASTITDFSRADGDLIDLSAIDANPATAAVDAFTFIGTAAFGGHAGELRVDTSGSYQVVYGDVNGDGVADFALNVSKGSGTLIGTDFVL